MRLGVDRRVPGVVAAFVLVVCVALMVGGSARAGAACVNEQLRAEQPYGLGLPDCRAFEKVSPSEKNSNDVDNRAGMARAAVSGDGLAFSSPGSFSGAASSKAVNTYLARRGAGGWSTLALTPRYRPLEYDPSSANPYVDFTPDLSKWLVLNGGSEPLTSDSPAGYINLYVGDTVSGAFRAVTTGPTQVGPYEYGASLGLVPLPGGASADLGHVVFQEEASLTPDARVGEGVQVYEWSDGKLTLVDVPPEGAPPFSSTDSIGAPTRDERTGDTWHAVSDDGSRVFFTAGEGTGSLRGRGQLYLREVNEQRTIEVSASRRAVVDPNGLQPARFWAANSDGSRVFFTSCAKLTDDSTAVSTKPNSACLPGDDGEGSTPPAEESGVGNDLYEYDVGTEALSDVTVDVNVGDPHGAGVLGVVSASEDGSYVYFVAEGVLAGAAISGQPNLYVRHDGETRFIVTLAKGYANNTVGKKGGRSDGMNWILDLGKEKGGPASHTAALTPDGKQLVFMSELSLTGYDNVPVEARECEPTDRCQEVYVYDASSGSLTCVSCNPSGARPTGPSELPLSDGFLGVSLILQHTFVPRDISADGRRVFFESGDSLVPHDSNGRFDVYEYEDGHVSLLSNGAGNYESNLLEASPNGNDVFFTTSDELLPEDQDNNIDVYDVRAGGGFPVTVTTRACDNGDACKPPVSPQPGVFGAPATATFSGAGNVQSQPQAKTKPKTKPGSKRKHKQKKKRGKHARNARKGASGRVKRS